MSRSYLLAGALLLAFAGAAGAAEPTDAFVRKAAAGGKAEVEAGKIVSTKASDAAVKNFAQRMVSDHGKAAADLEAVLKKAGKAAPPAELMPEHKALIDKLNAASGKEVDRIYVDAMVEDHDKDVKEFEEYAKSGDDKEIQAFARRTLSVIQEHDKMIHDIQAKMKRDAATR